MPDKASLSHTGKFNSHEGHRKRVREQFHVHRSLDGMPDHNVLELLLFYAIPRKDTNELAHKLLERFGSFDRVLTATHEELTAVDGITENAATLIELIIPLYKRYAVSLSDGRRTFSSVREIVEYLRSRFIGDTNERVFMLCFDSSSRLTNCVQVSSGDIGSTGLDMRRVVELAIEQRTCMVILAHNHPHGIALPSNADIEATIKASAILKSIKVKLADHIIITDNDYCAMSESDNFSKFLFGGVDSHTASLR